MEKVTLQSVIELRNFCQVCNGSYLSPKNCLRHILVDHSKQKAISSTITKERLEELWNELPVERQKEVLHSIESGVVVADVKVPGPSFKDLEMFAQKYKGYIDSIKIKFESEDSPLARQTNYLRAASLLMHIVENSDSPTTAEELFSTLKKASEGTFMLGELSSVVRSMFEKKEDRIDLTDVVAYSSFILERQLVMLAEEKAKAIADEMMNNEAARKSDQDKKKKKKKNKKKGQQGSSVETGAGEIVVDDEPANEVSPTVVSGAGEIVVDDEQANEVSPTVVSTKEAPISTGEAPVSTGETGALWNKIIKGGHTVLDGVGLMPILSLYDTRMLSQLKMTIPVWDDDRFHAVYQKMLRDIIAIIVRLERKGICTGTLGDEDIHIILCNQLGEQETRVLNNIEGNGDSELRVEFRDLVVRLKQQEGEKNIPEELTNFLDMINMVLSGQLSGDFFLLLIYHPWLMPLMERFLFPYQCWLQLTYELPDSWESKLRTKTPSGFNFPNEVQKMEDRFKQIYENGDYENNFVGVLEFCRNVILHFQKDAMKCESMQKCVYDFLSRHFPNIMLELFEFFVEENLSLDFMYADKEDACTSEHQT